MIQLRPFEPILPSNRGLGLSDLAMELAVEAAAFKSSINPELSRTLGQVVRSMNCYYSNLIEGHHTHPIDIERALAGHYDHKPEQRNLQLEARAHIEVQELIDRGEAPSPSTSEDFLRWTHRQFCKRLPTELLTIDGRTVEPGAYRRQHVLVGHHVAPEPEAVPMLMKQFADAYAWEGHAKTERIILLASAHHRLVWVHPFLDGNGRVARLFSHAALRECGIGSELWSISRGLARNVSDYKAHLAAADEPRRGDIDGRGNLSDQALGAFCRFFLMTCLDQVRYMRSLLDPPTLVSRIGLWADEQIAIGNLPRGSRDILTRVATDGSIPRGRAPEITGYQERQARNVIRALLARRHLVADGPKAPVRLCFTVETAERWLPLLYPTTTTS